LVKGVVTLELRGVVESTGRISCFDGAENL